MPPQLRYSPEAADDLETIYRHIALDNPPAADRFVREIEARCEALSHAPEIGRPRPDLREGVRIVSMRRRVVIAYKIGDHTIEILRVFYGGRDYEAIISARDD